MYRQTSPLYKLTLASKCPSLTSLNLELIFDEDMAFSNKILILFLCNNIVVITFQFTPLRYRFLPMNAVEDQLLFKYLDDVIKVCRGLTNQNSWLPQTAVVEPTLCLRTSSSSSSITSRG